MKKLFLLMAALSLAGSAGMAHAAEDKPLTPQQRKMATCNEEAVGKKGDERKAFMKECLSARKSPTQQEKMKICNQEAVGKKGNERRAFMKECLSKST